MSGSRLVSGDYEESTTVFSQDDLAQVANDTEDSRRHVLVRMTGADVGQVIALPKDEYVVGRRSNCDLVLNTEGVSRRHARFVFEGGNYYIEDLGSANGTAVKGQQIKRHLLQDGDVVQFGPRMSVRYSITDPSEESMLRQLYEASVRDSLTGCYNREYLSERLNSEVLYAKRHKTQSSLIMFDLDHFKKVNDTYGHQAGDAVLVSVADVVQRTLRGEDVFARYGGEEFAISLRGIDIEGAAQVAERIRALNERSVEFESQRIPITISVGCAALAGLDEPSPG